MQKHNKIQIVLTGGHAATTALAVIQELQKNDNYNLSITWIGEGRRIEKDIFSAIDVQSYGLIAGKLHRKFSTKAIISLLKIPVGFLHSLFLIIKIRPKVVLSFGGFVALPVVFSAWILRIPVILHEQTNAVGLANKISSIFAKRITLAWTESIKFFPKYKSVVVGNPLSVAVQSVRYKKVKNSPPTLLVIGGSRGSQIINEALTPIIPNLIQKFNIIHQTGDLDFEQFVQLKEKLMIEKGRKYQIFSTISPFDIGNIYEKSDIIVARAGANTVWEILAIGRPALFIPIPWTRYDEQTKNALVAQNHGVAEILYQGSLTSETLYKKIIEINENWNKYAKNYDESFMSAGREAAVKISQETLKLL